MDDRSSHKASRRPAWTRPLLSELGHSVRKGCVRPIATQALRPLPDEPLSEPRAASGVHLARSLLL